MTDELDEIRKVFQAGTPKPDAEAKARHLRIAQENFDKRQGLAAGARPDVESRPKTGWLASGAKTMLNTITGKGALAATTALVATTVIVMTPATRDIIWPADPLPVAPFSQTEGSGARSENQPLDLVDGIDSDLGLVEQRNATAPVSPLPQVVTPSREVAEKEEADATPQPLTAKAKTTSGQSFASELNADAPALLESVAPPQPRRLQVVPQETPFVEPKPDTEAFSNAAPNPLRVVTEEPVSTFSIDVDTASYSVIRSSLTAGHLPPREAVRIEEMINYFPYAYPTPEAGGAPFQPTVTVIDTPWNPDTDLVHIALQGEMPPLEERPPLNLVFLIDTSGSMQDTNKLPLLKQSFRLMLGQLRDADEVAIVTYAGSAGMVLEPTPAGERRKILAALDRLQAGGSTAGQAGLQQAYAVAEDMAEDGRLSRVILATDGDFNVGLSDPGALKEFIAEKRDTGTFLSVLGFGRGNLDDATMQALAQNGNGQAAYIDTLGEAQKVLVDQLTGALFPIAKDVKIQVEFNPAVIAEYQLIGYETRALRREDFNNDAVDAGEIGAGHAVTAIYEVTPVGSPAIRNEPLRYQEQEVATASDASGEIGFLRLRYKEPDQNRSQLIETPILSTTETAIGTEANFAAAIAGFGELLRGSDSLGDWSWGDAIALASENRGPDQFGYRAEAMTLMRLAESLSQ